ncbi:hypothetical protein J6590_094460, partial [Homalodisca vitripennis]
MSCQYVSPEVTKRRVKEVHVRTHTVARSHQPRDRTVVCANTYEPAWEVLRSNHKFHTSLYTPSSLRDIRYSTSCFIIVTVYLVNPVSPLILRADRSTDKVNTGWTSASQQPCPRQFSSPPIYMVT